MASKLYKRIFFLSTFKTFTDLPLSNATLRAVNDLGFTELTPIQAQILPHTLAN
ncbi:MAG: ATP-dependent RNA helicase RhlB, partial [Psychrobacter faecalis]